MQEVGGEDIGTLEKAVIDGQKSVNRCFFVLKFQLGKLKETDIVV